MQWDLLQQTANLLLHLTLVLSVQHQKVIIVWCHKACNMQSAWGSTALIVVEMLFHEKNIMIVGSVVEMRVSRKFIQACGFTSKQLVIVPVPSFLPWKVQPHSVPVMQEQRNIYVKKDFAKVKVFPWWLAEFEIFLQSCTVQLWA